MRSFSISGKEKARPRRSSSKSGSRSYGRRRGSQPGGILDIEGRLARRGLRLIAGVDEAGRGPLAGPVVACAIILRPGRIPPGIADSKQLSPQRRVSLYEAIKRDAIAIGTGVVHARWIDRMNILKATMLAMSRAVGRLGIDPECILVDGNRLPQFGVPAIAVVGGDRRCISIAAASIVAKVTRDRFMDRMDTIYPRYRFKANKGYGTPGHIEALRQHGPTRVHRYSFDPVAEMVGRRV